MKWTTEEPPATWIDAPVGCTRTLSADPWRLCGAPEAVHARAYDESTVTACEQHAPEVVGDPDIESWHEWQAGGGPCGFPSSGWLTLPGGRSRCVLMDDGVEPALTGLAAVTA